MFFIVTGDVTRGAYGYGLSDPTPASHVIEADDANTAISAFTDYYESQAENYGAHCSVSNIAAFEQIFVKQESSTHSGYSYE